jgi:hypothetical protein
MKASYIFIGATVIALLIYFILPCIRNDEIFSENNGSKNKIYITDTVIVNRPSEPIIINKVKLKTVKVSDTIYKSEAFAATLDTVIKSDTIKAKYEFPNNNFSLDIKRKPDSILIKTVLIQNEAKIKNVSLYEKVILFIGGLAAGYIITK